MQSNQQILQRLNTQIGELQGTNKQMLQLGTDVKIRYKNNKGRVELRFGSLDELERIYRRFFRD